MCISFSATFLITGNTESFLPPKMTNWFLKKVAECWARAIGPRPSGQSLRARNLTSGFGIFVPVLYSPVLFDITLQLVLMSGVIQNNSSECISTSLIPPNMKKPCSAIFGFLTSSFSWQHQSSLESSLPLCRLGSVTAVNVCCLIVCSKL